MSTGSNAICWGANTAIPCACITAKGTLISGTAINTPTALAVGTNGQVLVANSACTTGLAWSNSITGICSGSYYRQTSASTTSTLDWATEAYKTISVSSAQTVSFTNPPASGVVGMMTVQISMLSGGSVTWPASVKWPGGTAPTLTTARTHLVMLSTADGGATVLGSYLVDYN
jgi:hypothetical protein